MRKRLLCLMLCITLLCGCAPGNVNPAESVPSTPSQPTDVTIPPGLLQPQPPSDSSVPTQPGESAQHDWIPTPYTGMDYPRYLARVRVPEYAGYRWRGKTGETEYFLNYIAEGYCVSSQTPGGDMQTHWVVPNSAEHAAVSFRLCDGVWAYGIRRDGTELIRMSLLTGEVESLFTAEAVACGSLYADDTGSGANLYLADHNWLYFLAKDKGRIGLYRMYLPTKALDRLHTEIPNDTHPHALYLIPPETTEKIQIVYMNPEMEELLLQQLSNPKSNYKAAMYIPVYSSENNNTQMQKYDFSVLWELESPEATRMWNPILEYLCILLQNNHNIPAKRICTYDTQTREITDQAAWATACEEVHVAAKQLVAVETES